MITGELADLLKAGLTAAQTAGALTFSEPVTAIKLEHPANKTHGDFSTNLALTLKKSTGINTPRDIAQKLLDHLPASSLIERAEIAGPGFINFFLKPAWLQDTLLQIEHEDTCYGTNNSRAGEKILIEFVSANPTGPISVVNGRAAALGDVLGSLLASQGCTVFREFYINDALNSTQLESFSASVYARYLQSLGHPLLMPAGKGYQEDTEEPGSPQSLPGKATVHFPETGYPGEYVRDIAAAIVKEVSDKYETGNKAERDAYFREATLRSMIEMQRNALASFGLHFDTWFYESSLYETGKVDAAIKTLKERGYAYEREGALWLKSTEFGDEKDRVLIRSNEKATYIAADAAYHDDKLKRGFTRLINIWGADHHGYVARLKAGVAALAYDPSRLEIILTQMVSLVRDGEAVIGGKRQGNVIELKEDLIDEIGKDAARFYFLLNSYETPATVDVELAKRQSNENPVYYVQYAHARLVNIVKKAEEAGYPRMEASQSDRALLTHPAELDLLRKLADYPEEVTLASRDYAPHRLTQYARELASLLNIFYENCRVLPGKDDPENPVLTTARLSLVNGARITLRNLLTLIGVSAPDKM